MFVAVVSAVAVVVAVVVVVAVSVAVTIDNPSVDRSRVVGKLDPRGRPLSLILSAKNVLWS